MKITAAIIAHNEMECLPGWFGAVAKWADEIVFGNHASTDGTFTYLTSDALKFGVPVSVVGLAKSAVWEKGFAFMRNQVAECATGDWIVWVDADEEVNAARETMEQYFSQNVDVVPQLTLEMKAAKPEWTINDREAIKREATWHGDMHWRCYRRASGIQWRGVIHEELYYANGTWAPSRGYGTPIETFHYNPVLHRDKSFLHAELLLQVYENPALRDGVNPYWYNVWVPQHLEEYREKRRIFREKEGIV